MFSNEISTEIKSEVAKAEDGRVVYSRRFRGPAFSVPWSYVAGFPRGSHYWEVFETSNIPRRPLKYRRYIFCSYSAPGVSPSKSTPMHQSLALVVANPQREERLEDMSIISWIIVGLIAGALGKLVMPGDEPGGFIVTLSIGMAGAVVGGFVVGILQR